MCNTFKLKLLLYSFKAKPIHRWSRTSKCRRWSKFQGWLIKKTTTWSSWPCFDENRKFHWLWSWHFKGMLFKIRIKRGSKFGAHWQSLQFKRGNSFIVSCHVTSKQGGSRVLAAHPHPKIPKVSPPPPPPGLVGLVKGWWCKPYFIACHLVVSPRWISLNFNKLYVSYLCTLDFYLLH